MAEGRTACDQMAMGAMTAHVMADYLDQGFTTVRDAGCNSLGIAKAVNIGRLPGPRIYPAGGFLSQTGGHADSGFFNNRIGDQDDLERHGFSYIVDSPAEVRKAARMNFRGGATHLKVMAGGGVASEFDLLHITESTFDETKAAVEIAEDCGTYVMVHAYHDRSINRAFDARVRVIEPGFLMSEATMKRIKKERAALSLQAVQSLEAFDDPDRHHLLYRRPEDESQAGQRRSAQHVRTGPQARLHHGERWRHVRRGLRPSPGGQYPHAGRVRIHPYQALKTATSSAGQVLSWSGGMNPYKKGPLGVIEEGAYADLILVSGNPLESLDALQRSSVAFVMKDGTIYKNTL